MFTPSPTKDTAVRFTAKVLADRRWDDAFNHYMSSGLQNREDVYTWISIYDDMYIEEMEKINVMVIQNYFRKREENGAVFVPIVLQRIVGQFAATDSAAGNQ